jgi:hypothetical protein
MPLDQRPDEVGSLVYTTFPLERDTEVIGQPRLRLQLSSTAETTPVVAKLCDVAPDGTSALVTKGYLNTSHRESHSDPSPIEPGDAVEIELELLACAYRFARGHRIRLDIAGADLLNIWPGPSRCANTVFHGGAHPSCLVLPVIPGPEAALPQPALGPAPEPQVDLARLRPPEFSITRDIIADTATVRFRVDYGRHWTNAATMTVSAREPAQAVVDGRSRLACDFPGHQVVVEAQCVTTSDASAFHHTVDVRITLNGQPHWGKSWAVSVPRRHI